MSEGKVRGGVGGGDVVGEGERGRGGVVGGDRGGKRVRQGG